MLKIIKKMHRFETFWTTQTNPCPVENYGQYHLQEDQKISSKLLKNLSEVLFCSNANQEFLNITFRIAMKKI